MTNNDLLINSTNKPWIINLANKSQIRYPIINLNNSLHITSTSARYSGITDVILLWYI